MKPTVTKLEWLPIAEAPAQGATILGWYNSAETGKVSNFEVLVVSLYRKNGKPEYMNVSTGQPCRLPDWWALLDADED